MHENRWGDAREVPLSAAHVHGLPRRNPTGAQDRKICALSAGSSASAIAATATGRALVDRRVARRARRDGRLRRAARSAVGPRPDHVRLTSPRRDRPREGRVGIVLARRSDRRGRPAEGRRQRRRAEIRPWRGPCSSRAGARGALGRSRLVLRGPLERRVVVTELGPRARGRARRAKAPEHGGTKRVDRLRPIARVFLVRILRLRRRWRRPRSSRRRSRRRDHGRRRLDARARRLVRLAERILRAMPLEASDEPGPDERDASALVDAREEDRRADAWHLGEHPGDARIERSYILRTDAASRGSRYVAPFRRNPVFAARDEDDATADALGVQEKGASRRMRRVGDVEGVAHVPSRS